MSRRDEPPPVSPPPPAVRLRGVSLRYGKKTALDGIDLDIPSGRLVGVIGPDGVGKSSLFALIAGARAIRQLLRGHNGSGEQQREQDRPPHLTSILTESYWFHR